jgi:TRAP-type C4-dicarboxylate transport system substrate-binding protein
LNTNSATDLLLAAGLPDGRGNMKHQPRPASGPVRSHTACTAALALLLLLAAGILAAAEPEGVITLKLHHMQSAAAPAHRFMLTEWKDKIEAESGGRLRIRMFPAMQLGGQSAAILDQVRDGITDIGWTLPGYSPGRFPRIEVFELPFVMSSIEVMNRAMLDFLANHPEEFADVRILQVFAHAGQVVHSKTPIRTADDFVGKKIRVPSRVSSWIVEALGGIPLGTPVGQVPEMLSKGIIDATLIPYEGSYGMKIHELVDYHSTLELENTDRFQTQIFVIAMNKEAYAALPADLRTVLDNNSGVNNSAWFAEKWQEFEIPGANAAAASGEVILIPAAEVAKIRASVEQPVIARWQEIVARKGIDGTALLEEARFLLNKHEQQP